VTPFFFQGLDRCSVGPALIDRDRVRKTVLPHRLLEETARGFLITMRREQEVDGRSFLIDGAAKVSRFFEGFCGIWAFGPRSARQAGAASCKIKWLEPRAASESAGSTRTLEEPVFSRVLNFDVRLVHPPTAAYKPLMVFAEGRFQLRGKLLNPAVNPGMIHVDAPPRQHFFQVPVAQGVRQVPPNTRQDEVSFKAVASKVDHAGSQARTGAV